MQFWQRWSRKDLNELQVRSKWKKSSQNPQVTQFALLQEGNDQFIDWKLARIMKTYKDDDGHVHIIDLKISECMLRRNVTTVVPLPFYDDVGLQSNSRRDVPSNYLHSCMVTACSVWAVHSRIQINQLFVDVRIPQMYSVEWRLMYIFFN